MQQELLNRIMYMANKPWVMPVEEETAPPPKPAEVEWEWPDAVVN